MARIALVTYELNQGGTNRVLCHLANGFAEQGHRVDVLYCTTARAQFDLDATLRKDVNRLAFGEMDARSRGFAQFTMFRHYCRWLRRERPDIVLATGNNISWFTALGVLITGAAKRYYVKTTNPIIRERDSRFITWIRRHVYTYIFRRAAGVLTLSDAETRMLQSQFPLAADKFGMVYNAYLTSQFETRDAPPRQKTDRPITILGVGRLVQQKRFDRLLRAFAAMRSTNARLRIAGEGKDREALTALAAELGIADRVELMGYTPDVPAVMADADLLVLSSDYEGLPAVVVEALASNLPVISTDCFANARDLLEGLPGCAVVEKTDDALTKALDAWMAAPPWGLELKPYAMRYSTLSATRSHLAAMT